MSFAEPLNSEPETAMSFGESENFPEPPLNSTALKREDWRRAQSSDQNIKFAIDYLIWEVVLKMLRLNR